MTPDEIKAELAKRGLSYDKVARRARPNRLTRSTIYKNVHQLPGAKSARARRLIASAIERDVTEVFGDAA
jgi:lambda repressor-like predicted transcriptional regulator